MNRREISIKHLDHLKMPLNVHIRAKKQIKFQILICGGCWNMVHEMHMGFRDQPPFLNSVEAECRKKVFFVGMSELYISVYM